MLKRWYALVDGIDETQEKLVLKGHDLYWVWRELEPEFQRLIGWLGGRGGSIFYARETGHIVSLYQH